MTLKTKGTIRTEKKTTIEAIDRGTRTTIVETGKLGTLDVIPIRRETDDGHVISSSVSRANDAYDIRTTVYEEVRLGNAQGDFDVRISASATEESIETHPDFESVLAGRGDDTINRAKFKDTTADAEFDYFPPNALNNLAGVESYLVPSVILEMTRDFTNFADIGFDQIYKIGKIATPPLNINVGNTRNWLVIGVLYDFDDESSVWKVTVQFQLSGEDGWNELIYNTA